MMNKQPLLLLIETATEVCSVALSRGTEIIGIKENAEGLSHAKSLLPFIDTVLGDNNLTAKDLDGVVVSAGPGSYTGLRIGASTAKGIAYTAGIPLISVGTLFGIAASCLGQPDAAGQGSTLIAPMIDARRMEVFTAVFDGGLSTVEEVSAKIIDENSFHNYLEERIVMFCGNGMPKCRDILSKHPNARFVEERVSAKNLLIPALSKWENGDFEDTAYFEPFYLKEYVAGKPVVKGLS